MNAIVLFVKARWPFFVGGIAIGFVIVLLATCHRDNSASKQAEQTSRSGEATSNAAAAAIATIGNQTATDASIDAATANATKDIDNAQSLGDVRDAVIDGVCGQSSHRNDPACRVQ